MIEHEVYLYTLATEEEVEDFGVWVTLPPVSLRTNLGAKFKVECVAYYATIGTWCIQHPGRTRKLSFTKSRPHNHALLTHRIPLQRVWYYEPHGQRCLVLSVANAIQCFGDFALAMRIFKDGVLTPQRLNAEGEHWFNIRNLSDLGKSCSSV